MATYNEDLKRKAKRILAEKPIPKSNEKRTAVMPCLLCSTNNATQKNSHIISKLLGKGLFGTKRKAFVMSSDKMDRKPRIVQDIPKEDFILCPSCEKYFGFLESYFKAKCYDKLWDSKYRHDFPISHIEVDMKLLECSKVDPTFFTLFIYSIVWRTFITSNSHFSHLHVNRLITEGLRKSLLTYKSSSLTQLINKVNANPGQLFPSKFLLFTSDSFSDPTMNPFIILPSANPYYYFLNKFQLVMSFDNNRKQNIFLNNNTVPLNHRIRIAKLSENHWVQVIKTLNASYLQASANNMLKAGKKMIDFGAFLKSQGI